MADARNFKKYIQELSGNSLLIKKMKALEKRNATLERKISDLSEEVKLLKKAGAMSAVPKKKGRKPRPMIRIVEDEMAKRPGGEMSVKDILKMLKQKKVSVKTANLYSSVASSLTQNPKFEKVAPGVFRLKSESPAPKKKAAKKTAKKKKAAKK